MSKRMDQIEMPISNLTFTNCIWFPPPVDISNVQKSFNCLSGFSFALIFGKKAGLWPGTLGQRLKAFSCSCSCWRSSRTWWRGPKIIRRFRMWSKRECVRAAAAAGAWTACLVDEVARAGRAGAADDEDSYLVVTLQWKKVAWRTRSRSCTRIDRKLCWRGWKSAVAMVSVPKHYPLEGERTNCMFVSGLDFSGLKISMKLGGIYTPRTADPWIHTRS